MTTIAEDRDSWKAGGIIRRDFRHARDDPEVPKPKHSRHKDTKHWCKGIVGREHVVGVKPVFSGSDWMCDYCEKCGKVLRWHEHVFPWAKEV